MLKTTLILNEELHESIQDYANDTSLSLNEVVVQALYYWFQDIEPDSETMAELGTTKSEWRTHWGMDANEVVHSLRERRKAH